MLQEHRFAYPEALFQALSEHCLALMGESATRHPAQTILLSGGNTPRPLYTTLAAAALPWSTIQVALVDERWVPPEHSASNEGMIRKAMQTAVARGLQITGMMQDSPTAIEGLEQVNMAYGSLPRPWTFALLGMGQDGHTASLFPDAQGLTHALTTGETCAALTARPSRITGDFLDRMSLGLNALLSTRQLFLLITGADKWQVYQQALASTTPEATPVSYLLQQTQVPIDIYWCP